MPADAEDWLGAAVLAELADLAWRIGRRDLAERLVSTAYERLDGQRPSALTVIIVALREACATGVAMNARERFLLDLHVSGRSGTG